jgi:CheY-like chemotaxis protein
MEVFELRRVCNELLLQLKGETFIQSIIKLSVDIQLPDRYVGNPGLLLHSIRDTASYLSGVLINGIVNIEITLRGVHGNLIALQTYVTGLGSSRVEQKEVGRFRQLVNNPALQVRYKESADEIVFEFNHMLQVADQEELKPKLPFERKRVLVAEDNEINAMVFCSFLEEWGIQTFTAINGAEAVSQAHDSGFDAILMDIHMPVLNGNDATRRIREFNATIPVIALTASTSEDDLRDALAAGANDYLLKPVSSTHLFQLLSRYL